MMTEQRTGQRPATHSFRQADAGAALRTARRLGVVFFPAFDWAISPTHPEREERLLYTRDQLVEEGLFDIPGITEYRPAFASHAQLERAHFCLPSARAVSTDSHLAAAGGAIRAARLVLEGHEDRNKLIQLHFHG